jgi:hypothetical protein
LGKHPFVTVGGELELELRRRQARLRQRPLDVVGEGGMVELAR